MCLENWEPPPPKKNVCQTQTLKPPLLHLIYCYLLKVNKWRIFLSLSGLGYGSYQFAYKVDKVSELESSRWSFKERKITFWVTCFGQSEISRSEFFRFGGVWDFWVWDLGSEVWVFWTPPFIDTIALWDITLSFCERTRKKRSQKESVAKQVPWSVKSWGLYRLHFRWVSPDSLLSESLVFSVSHKTHIPAKINSSSREEIRFPSIHVHLLTVERRSVRWARSQWSAQFWQDQ